MPNIDVTRECIRAVVDTSISVRRVVRELADLIGCAASTDTAAVPSPSGA